MEAPEKIKSHSESATSDYHCTECIAGVRRLQYLTYFTWYRDQLITVPNFPAWVCDICGKRDYDTKAVSWLQTILNTHKNRSFNRRSAYT